jgi:hypothetical protein
LPPGTNGVPRAGAGRPGAGTTTTSKALVALLRRNASSYTWVAATGSSMSAAPIQLATGKPVMSIGGFNGNDQAMTLTRFEQLVAAGRIHYYLGSAGGPGGFDGGPGGKGPGGGGGASSEIGAWVAKTFATTTVGGVTVYDLTSPLASLAA